MARVSGDTNGRPRGRLARYGLVGLVCALAALGVIILTQSGQRLLGPDGLRQAVVAFPMPPDGRPLLLWVLAGPGKPLAPGEVAVTYLNQGDLAVERVPGVIEVRRYIVKGRLEQMGLFVAPFRAIVFNRPYLVSYRAAPGIPETVTVDDTFHHYDTQAEGEKMVLREAAVRESYHTLLGREPSEREMLTWLDDLTRGVYPPEMEVRLAQSRGAAEAALRRVGRAEASGPWAWLTRERRIARVLAGDLTLADLSRS